MVQGWKGFSALAAFCMVDILLLDFDYRSVGIKCVSWNIVFLCCLDRIFFLWQQWMSELQFNNVNSSLQISKFTMALSAATLWMLCGRTSSFGPLAHVSLWPPSLLPIYISSFTHAWTHWGGYSLSCVGRPLEMKKPSSSTGGAATTTRRRRRRRTVPPREKEDSPQNSVQGKLRKLESIIPGRQDDSIEGLLMRTAEYISFLELQVDVLKSLSHLYGVSPL